MKQQLNEKIAKWVLIFVITLCLIAYIKVCSGGG